MGGAQAAPPRRTEPVDRQNRGARRAFLMNNLLLWLGQADWKPVLTALVLPPVPLLLLVLAGARAVGTRRRLGWSLVLVGVVALWLSTCAAVGDWLMRQLPGFPPSLSPPRVAEIREQVAGRVPVAIVVLGGGLETRAPEYAAPNLSPLAAERLRYGLWLARETGAPVGFSGGVGWAHDASAPAEARIAAGIAQRDFGVELRWIEDASRDTRENAQRMSDVLARDGIRQVVLVSHGWHLPRALRAFEQAGRGRFTVTPAPMGLAPRVERPVLRWLPSGEGTMHTRQVLREWLGWWMGA
jgi:uncharacterized SAM-binding protein YcdF (DUF218 family)